MYYYPLSFSLKGKTPLRVPFHQYMCVCMSVCMSESVCMYVMYVCNVCVCTYIYVYTYIRTYKKVVPVGTSNMLYEMCMQKACDV